RDARAYRTGRGRARLTGRLGASALPVSDVAEWFLGAEARCPDARGDDQADHAGPVAAIRLEELEHPLIRRAWRSFEGEADRVREVVVTDRNRVGVAQRDHRHLRGRPHTDSGKRAQPSIRAWHVHLRGLLEP